MTQYYRNRDNLVKISYIYSESSIRYYIMKPLTSIATLLIIISTAIMAQGDDKSEVYELGKYEICILVENSGTGTPGILIDATEDILAKHIPEGTFHNAVNAVLIKGEGKVWLIDTGFGHNIFGKMAELGVQPEDVGYVLLTHMHGDHIGGMFRDGKKSFPNAEVIVSRKEFDYWSSKEEMDK